MRALALPLLLALAAPALAGTKLLRFPDVHGDTVVFCHAGDLSRRPRAGARRA
jgi:tricorn protease